MGWPQKVKPALSPYFARRNELTIEEDCLLRGIVVKMKALARSHVWWPGMDKALEEVTKHCEECHTNQKEDLKTPLHPLEFTSKPWQRIHLDFAGPFQRQMWLILIDSYSRWPEVVPMRSTTAGQTIKELNGPQFVSEGISGIHKV